MKRRALLTILLIAFIGAGALWLGDDSEDRLQESQQESHSGIDYYMTGFTVTEMDERGHPLHRLEASHLSHSVDDDTIHLEQPRATLYRPEESDWHLKANHGIVESEGELLRLEGDVVAHVPAQASQPMTNFRTDTLLVRPNDYYAETEAPVVITHNGSRVDAIGMRAYFEDERVELLSAVKGYYEP